MGLLCLLWINGLEVPMKRRMRLTHILPVVLICFLMPLFSAYLDYIDFADVDFPSRDRSIENPDQVNLLVAEQSKPKLFEMGWFSIVLRPEIDLLEQFSDIALQMPPSDQKTAVLRC